MFIELTREKIIITLLIAGVLLSGIALSVLADSAWSITPQAGYAIARSESGFFYWLFYGGGSSDTASAPEGTALSVPVLLYHGEGSGSDMPTAVFVDQMRKLKQDGWRTITMRQFEEWEKGKIQLPDKSFLLTFDDGRTDTFYQADPVLQDLGFNAVMFTITGFSLPESGKVPHFYLNETELRNMVKSGRWELESHGAQDHAVYAVQSTTDLTHTASTTDGHFLSNKFWNSEANRFETNAEFATRITEDLTTSRKKLESTFGITVDAFAYPFNDFGENSVNFASSQAILDRAVPSVYTFAFYQTWAGNGDLFNYPSTNNGPGATPYMIKRFEPQASWSGEDLVAVMSAAHAKTLPYSSSSFGKDWAGTWGTVSATGNALSLSASAQTTGASAFLSGTGWWTNYLFSATVHRLAGSNISLLARDSTQDYVACAFSSSRVALERHLGETQTVIKSADYDSASSARLGIGVVGGRATCYVEGVPVVSAQVAMASHGGIGVEIWDATPGVAHSTVSSVSVTRATDVSMPVSVSQPASASAAVQSAEPTTSVQLEQTVSDTRPVPDASATATSSPASSSINVFERLKNEFMNARRRH